MNKLIDVFIAVWCALAGILLLGTLAGDALQPKSRTGQPDPLSLPFRVHQFPGAGDRVSGFRFVLCVLGIVSALVAYFIFENCK